MNLEDFFDRIEKQFENKLPFVAYRNPNQFEVNALLQKDDLVYEVNDFTEIGFVFAPFDDKEDAILIPNENSDILKANNAILNTPKAFVREESHHVKTIDDQEAKQHHINLVKKGIEAVKAGHFEKVVLSRKEAVNYSEASPIQIFKCLLNSYPSAFVYCWYHPKTGLWLGATPESLLKVSGNRFTTMALAGTQVYDKTLDVIWYEKDKNEQQIVVDYIVSSIQASAEKINTSKTKTVKAGNLLHLQTIISGTFNFQLSLSDEDLAKSENLKHTLGALHPTPAVCGLPKVEAKQFILENENYNREFYTGFLGELNSGNSGLYVNLRCMQLKGGEVSLYVGGGITKDSNPENEWEETIDKAKIMKRVL